MITGENIRIQSRFTINHLADMQIEIKEGCHGKLVLRGYLASGEESAPLTGDGIKVICLGNGGETQEQLFCGIIQTAHICVENGVRQVILSAATPDIKMDKEEDSRSFQDIRMTGMQVVNQTLDKYHGKAFCDNPPVQTGIPVVQYKETDWQFLKRMAGYMGLGVFCDGVTELPRIRLGLPETGRKVSFDADSYKCRMDEVYYHGWKGEGLGKGEFLYYQVESEENYAIGDYAYYKGQKRYIFEKQAEWKGSALFFYYKLGGKYRFQRQKEFNGKLAGAALAGEVVRTDKETVYLKLDIDGENGKAVYPYPWSPVMGNVMYSMPQTGTKAYLYFPDCHEERAFAGSSIRMGQMEGLFADPQGRMFETEHGKQLQLYADSMALRGGKGNRTTAVLHGRSWLRIEIREREDGIYRSGKSDL